MATNFESLRVSSDTMRSAIDTVLGAAGTRMALGALRRYPKTALAISLVAGLGAIVAPVLKARAERSKAKPRRKTTRRPAAKTAAA